MSNKIGKLKVCRVHDLNEHKSMVNFAIVRNLIFPINSAVHLPELAPSEDLFRFLMDAKKQDNLSKLREGLDVFKKNIKGPNYRAVIAMIQQEFLDKGFDVTLACYCENADLCHRKIVAEEFSGYGYSVEIF